MKLESEVPPHWTWSSNLQILDALAQHLLAIARLAGTHLVIDIASGRGTCSIAFAPKVSSVTAFDVSEKQVQACRDKALELGLHNLQAVQHDVHTPWPFEDHTIDIVTGVGAISNLDNPKLALAEARRVLKADGQLLIGDFFIPEKVQEVWRALSSFRLGAPRPYLDYYDFLDLLYDSGFEPIIYRPIRWKAGMAESMKKVSDEMRNVFLAALVALREESIKALHLERDGDDVITERHVFALSAVPFERRPRWYIDETPRPSALHGGSGGKA